MKRIFFVRHGETTGNRDVCFQDENTPLTELGHQQAEAVANRFKHMPVDQLVASPFIRTVETAKHIEAVTGLRMELFRDFHECMQPLYVRGKSKLDGESGEYQKRYLEYFVMKDIFAEGFENFDTVIKRAKSCVEFLKNCNGNNVVIVSHNAFIRVLSAYLLLGERVNMDHNIVLAGSLSSLSNTGITEFTYDTKWQLVSWNDQVHFAE
jgi:broad specificity phosphatase PhoE